jgi:hypothetical protein
MPSRTSRRGMNSVDSANHLNRSRLTNPAKFVRCIGWTATDSSPGIVEAIRARLLSDDSRLARETDFRFSEGPLSGSARLERPPTKPSFTTACQIHYANPCP